MLTNLVLGFSLGFSAAATPGPMQAFLLAEALQHGWRRTLPAALAPLLSDGPIVILILFVISQASDTLLRGLRLAGGLFVLYLAWGAWQARRASDRAGAPAARPQSGIWKATVTNLLNPNPYIFWATIAGPLLLTAWRTTPAWGVAFMVGIYGTLVGGFALLIILFASAGRADPRLQRALSVLSAVALFGFAVYQFWRVAVG